MKIPKITLKKILEVIINKAVRSFDELKMFNETALREEYKERILAIENGKDQPHVLYTNQINIEQL